ncbi:MAG: ABC transporter permease [Thermoanaerobaculia bacterium]
MASETAGETSQRRTPLLGWGGGLVGLVALAAVAAPLLAPHDPIEQVDPVSARHRPPGTRLLEVRLDDGARLLADEVELADEGVRLRRRDEWRTLPRRRVINLEAGRIADRRSFPLGSDRLGRDLLSRILYGARVSLLVGLLAGGLALALGLAIGGGAGLAGGWLDVVLMRAADALLSFPRLFLLLGVAGLFDLSTGWLILILGATSWMGAARLVRAEVRTVRRRGFVAAARSSGTPPLRVLLRHLLPAALTPVIVDTTLRIGDLILIEAALSYLGLGVQPPLPSWGNLVADGSDALMSAWWVTAFPGAALALTVIGLNLLGDGLRDHLDPRHT